MEGLLGTPVHQAGIRSANKVTLTPCCQGKTVREGDLMKKPTCRFPGRSAPVVPQELLRAGVGRVQLDRQEEVFAGEGALPFLAEQFAQVGVGPGEVGLVADRGAQGGEGDTDFRRRIQFGRAGKIEPVDRCEQGDFRYPLRGR